ncbi:MAG: SGNH/GDSL hydrolase family protein [Intrasporangium sp.]|uniref:SGNH/GDSL hydrolase family protein n=1 Tax=Intrasporangium sp. TaxID=1925024 RepID=UPI002648D6F3|nr:SGNH/GDSL hydrolase family protein [Intrasporangium sp.]MDN5795306.1 SGNH/GDSL hydrolase family protein [Intrasporangium sp.]
MVRRRRFVVSALAAVAVVFSALLVGAPSAAASPSAPASLAWARPPVASYVALGDSYTAAPLVPRLIPADGCTRSTNNYPHLVARTLGITDFVDASCSGAQTKDMFTSQLPGVAPQLDALRPDTQLVTLSIGGNDFSVFGTLVGYCTTLRAGDPTGDPCRQAMQVGGQDRLLAAVAVTQQRIVGVVAAIRSRAPHARILLVGYPQIVPTHGTCPALLPLADGDYPYGYEVNLALTEALQNAAAQTGVGYVDVWRASRGHSICASFPWVNGQHTKPLRAAAYHPFLVEQAAVAVLVDAAVYLHGWRAA